MPRRFSSWLYRVLPALLVAAPLALALHAQAPTHIALDAWNLVDPGDHGTTHTLDLTLQGVPANASVTIQRVDDTHGNVLPRYAAPGSPIDPPPAQVIQLNQETALPAPESTHLHDGKLALELSPNALLLIKVQP